MGKMLHYGLWKMRLGTLSMVSGLAQFASSVKRYEQAWLILERHQKHGARLMLELQLNIGPKWDESFQNFNIVRQTGKLTV